MTTNTDEVIRVAKEAGGEYPKGIYPNAVMFYPQQLQRFADLLTAPLLAEIERLKERFNDADEAADDAWFKVDSLNQQLAAQAAQIERMRDVIGEVANNLGEFAGAMPTQAKADIVSRYASQLFACLSTPDPTAIRSGAWKAHIKPYV